MSQEKTKSERKKKATTSKNGESKQERPQQSNMTVHSTIVPKNGSVESKNEQKKQQQQQEAAVMTNPHHQKQVQKKMSDEGEGNKTESSGRSDAKKRKNPPQKQNVPEPKDEKIMTKRQKRLQPNDKHLWPQQPKIQNSEQRANAYLRVAGLQEKSSTKSSPLKPNLTIDGTTNNDNIVMSNKDEDNSSNTTEMKFGRLLGNPNQRIRHEAIHQMSLYLKAKTDLTDPNSSGISELDLLKLWKGVWYCLYMADKVPVQDELSKRIANLLFSVAGTEEEDEYAARAYIKICSDGGDEGDDDDDASHDDGQSHEGEDDDDSVDMDEIERTLCDTDEQEEGDDEDNDDDDDDTNNSTEDAQGMDVDCDGNNGNHENEDNQETNALEVKHCRGAHLASLFVKTFFQTIRREWGKLDKYRVDKFYTLIRHMMYSVYKYMAMRHWRHGIVQLFNHAIYDEVLLQQPDGIRYHLIDIVLDEIVKVHNTMEIPLPLTEPLFIDCLEPFFAMAQTGASIGHDIIQKRIVENIFVKFLEKCSIVSDNANAYYSQLEKYQKQLNENTETESNPSKKKKTKTKKDDTNAKKQQDIQPPQITFLDDVHVKTVADFIFDLASDPETYDRYRKSLYDTHKLYIRRLQEVGRDVDLDKVAHDEDYDDDNEGGEDYEIDDDRCNDEVENEDIAVTADKNDETGDEGKDTSEHYAKNGKEKKKKKKKSKDKKVEKEGYVVEVDQTDDSGDAGKITSEPNIKNAKQKRKKNKDNKVEKHDSKKDVRDVLQQEQDDSLPNVKSSQKKSKKDKDETITLSSTTTGGDVKQLPNSEKKVSDEHRKALETCTDGRKSSKSKSKNKPKAISESETRKEVGKGKSSDLSHEIKEKDTGKRLHDREDSKHDSDVVVIGKISTKASDEKKINTTNETRQQESSFTTPQKQVESVDGDNKQGKLENELSTYESTQSKKKNKKKKKKGKDKEEGNASAPTTPNTTSPSSTINNRQDDEVLISLREQKQAVKKVKDTSTPEKKTKASNITPMTTTNTTITSSGKRVKFGEMNRARSWTVSIKNLVTMETPISKQPPEQGILRNKHKMHKELLSKVNEKRNNSNSKHNSSNSNGTHRNNNNGNDNNGNSNKMTQRKKATDYFS